jgi:hypothetical protein
MLEVALEHDVLVFGKGFALDFQRTLRIPDDGRTYPLPPGLGTFPLRRIEDYRERVPHAWVQHGGVFIPMYQREALWISFRPRYWKPNAVKIAVGKVNAVSGKPWDERLRPGENDYLVCPPQPWLDGINAGDEYIRQFVAMPLGMGYTVEGQVTGAETFGGIQIVVYEPKPGRFPDQPPAGAVELVLGAAKGLAEGAAMGLAAGGKVKQNLYPDPYGIDTWDEENYGRIFVHIVNSMMYREITGNEPPPTPVTARMYAEYGLPWFDVYDDAMPDLSASAVLSEVKTVKEIDKEKGFTPQQDDGTVSIPEENTTHFKLDLDDAGDDGDS